MRDDCILYKTGVVNFHGDGNMQPIQKLAGLKGPITFKPDCEGYTIDERIHQCKKEKLLNNQQFNQLKSILNNKRERFGLANVNGFAG